MKKRYTSNGGKKQSRVGVAVARVSWTYLIVLVALWIFLRFWGDDWWLATLMLFGPLWVTALPLAVLAPAAIFISRRSLLPLALAGGVAFFCLLDFCVPWRPLLYWRRTTEHLRVLTCNVHGKALDGPALGRVIVGADPDIVVLQEAYVDWKIVENYTHSTLRYARRDGELFIASRYPIEKSEDFGDPRWSGWGGAADRYEIAAPAGVVYVFNIHLASPHLQFQGVIDEKAASVEKLQGHLAVRSEQSQKLSTLAATLGGNVILAGDFNTICQGSIYHESWAQFSDAFTTAGWGMGHTYFDAGAVVRIDHILSGSQWRCRRCWVGPDVGSPHRPVIADLETTDASR